MMAAGLAVLVMGAAGGETARPVDVVAALIQQPPGVLSGLEAVVGPLHRNPAKWEDAVGPLHRVSPSPAVARAGVELAIDIFHQDPAKVEDPDLAHWDLDFQTGRDACRRLLAQRFPKPRELRADGRPLLRFGDFYFTPLDAGDGFRLSWYREEPLFAIPGRSEGETARLLADLAAIANAGFTRQAIEARLGRLVPIAGMQGISSTAPPGTWSTSRPGPPGRNGSRSTSSGPCPAAISTPGSGSNAPRSAPPTYTCSPGISSIRPTARLRRPAIPCPLCGDT